MMKFILILALLLSVVSIVSSSVSGRNLKIDIKGANLAYDYIKASSPSAPAVFFLPGLVREKNEGKGISLQSFCKKQDFTFLSADYFGVGRSEGTFADGCLSRWTEDSIHILDKVLKNSGASGRGGIGKTVLVGHGVGSWISFLIAAKRPDLVRGIVGMSSDPDFTEELLWKTLSDDVKEQIMRDGVYEITWGKEKYPITRNLIEDGRKNLLLVGGKDSISISCPVRLIHALNDEEVSFNYALRLAENVKSRDVSVALLKDASHDMEGEDEFKAMRSAIVEVMAAYQGEFDLTSPGSG